MGNRSFLYTTDQLPDLDNPHTDEPTVVACVAEANNCLPPLWRILLSAALAGPAQDAQQVFLPSLCGGIYAARTLAEERMFRLLDFVAGDPDLPDPDELRRQTESLKAALAGVEGTAYCADLNEWYALVDDGELSPEDWLDDFAADCARCWDKAERAMARGDYLTVAALYEFDAAAAADMLGFRCWHVLEPDWSDNNDIDLGEDMELIEENGKYGIRHGLSGEVIVAPVLDEVFGFVDGLAVAAQDGRYGHIGIDGAWRVAPSYDNAFDFCAGLAQVVRDGLSGYVNASGQEVIAPRFLPGSGSFCAAGFAPVQTDSGWGVIDRSGTLVVPPTYDELEWIDSLDAWQAGTGEHIDVFHADGHPWFSGVFDSVFGLAPDGDAVVERDGKLGTWQRGGAPGLPLEFDDIDLLAGAFDAAAQHQQPHQRLYVVGRNTNGAPRQGLYRADGQMVLPLAYRSVHGVHAGASTVLVALDKNGTWTIFNAAGQALHAQPYDWLVAPLYADAQDWQMEDLLDEIGKAWNANEPILAGRGDERWCLAPDGSAESELDHLLRAARAAPPIVRPRGVLRHVFSRAERHCIEGVGDPDSCARLGDIYAFGDGAPADEQAALRWYATAAHGGHEGARYQYAHYLVEGIGCTADPLAAREQLEALAPDHKLACHLLGYLHEYGLGGKADPVKARTYYELAATGDRAAVPEAQLRAGNCWKLGIGGPVDKHRALAYIEMAAHSPQREEPYLEAIWAAAQLNAQLAREAHAAGEHEEHRKRLDRAIGYYTELVELGDKGGLLGLARCALGDYGGSADIDKGRAYLDQTAGTDVAELADSIRQEHGLDA